MINKSLKERMRLNDVGGWDYPYEHGLIRIYRKEINDSWKQSISFYLKKDYNSSGLSLADFFSKFIPKKEIGEISYEGHIAILIDEALFRKNPQLEFDFNLQEKVSV